jgi:small nuclear ribonucleoprotein (snRNP)-like protein
MMNRAKVLSSFVVAFTAIFCATVLYYAPDAGAQSRVTAIQGVNFTVSGSFMDNLKALAGKDVYINLHSGKTYQGFLKSVGDHLIHVEKIAGKEYFDALIRIEDISAIEVKFRDFK